MLDVKADLGGLLGPLVTGLVLVVGAWSALRSANQGPRRGRHRAHGGTRQAPGGNARRTRRVRPSMPAPVAGAAAGLLESIPFLEPVRRRRLRGTARLGTTLVLSAAFAAMALFLLGRTMVDWLNSFQP